MKTNPATSVTDFRSIAIGGCFALFALLLSIAASAVATDQKVQEGIAKNAIRPAAIATVRSPVQWAAR